MSRCLLSPSRFVFFIEKKPNTHTKSVGVFTPTSPNLSKHAGFQTIQSCAKETRQTGPRVMLSQQRMSDLKGKRGFVGNLHTRDFESFQGRLWAAGSHSFGSGRTIISLFDGLHSHMFFEWFSCEIFSHFERANERKMFAFARGEKKGDRKMCKGQTTDRKTRHSIHFHCVLHALRAQISDLVDDALTHLPPLCVARWHGVAQLENNGRSRPSGCSLHVVCLFEWEWYADLQGT